ncbi:unnamed protein product, partial [Mesorhabditis belari]|uniref:Uncharacterized protein n=1 Tax=Mesorhabditis belari TaxID=2138241 RepID=A0AAF3FCR2_9BILA
MFSSSTGLPAAEPPAMALAPSFVVPKTAFEEKLSKAQYQKQLLELELKCTDEITEQISNLCTRVARLRLLTAKRYRELLSTIPITEEMWRRDIHIAEKQLLNLPNCEVIEPMNSNKEEKATDVERRLAKLAMQTRNLAMLDHHLYKQGRHATEQRTKLGEITRVVEHVSKQFEAKERKALRVVATIDDEHYPSGHILANFSRSIFFIGAAVDTLQLASEIPQLFGLEKSVNEIHDVRSSLNSFLNKLKSKLGEACVGVPKGELEDFYEEQATESIGSPKRFNGSTTKFMDPDLLSTSISQIFEESKTEDLITAVPPDFGAETPRSVTAKTPAATVLMPPKSICLNNLFRPLPEETKVWKVQSEISGDVYIFERSCSEVCKEGCTHIADMEHRFVAFVTGNLKH